MAQARVRGYGRNTYLTQWDVDQAFQKGKGASWKGKGKGKGKSETGGKGKNSKGKGKDKGHGGKGKSNPKVPCQDPKCSALTFCDEKRCYFCHSALDHSGCPESRSNSRNKSKDKSRDRSKSRDKSKDKSRSRSETNAKNKNKDDDWEQANHKKKKKKKGKARARSATPSPKVVTVEDGPAAEIFSPSELKKLGVSKSLDTDFRGLFKFPFPPRPMPSRPRRW